MDSSDGEVRRTSGNIKRHASGKGSTKHKKKDQHESKGLERGYSQDESMEVVTTKKNGYMDGEEVEAEEDKTKHSASIKNMWKKAFKSLKSNDSSKLSKKGNQTKRKVSESEMEVSEPAQGKDIDPVYSLLKSAAYLPKGSKPGKDSPSNSFFSSRGDSLDNSSKTSSPLMSGPEAPQEHPGYSTQHSIEGASSISSREGRATSPAFTKREHMHHIVDESLGSEFRTFYKLTSPVKKHGNELSSKKTSPNASFDHH